MINSVNFGGIGVPGPQPEPREAPQPAEIQQPKQELIKNREPKQIEES